MRSFRWPRNTGWRSLKIARTLPSARKSRSADGCCAHVGSIGDIGCFSFFGNKNMTTGEGGMIVTNDDILAEKIRLLRSHGMTALTYDRHKGHASGYDVVALGYNYRMDELRAALGLSQLAKLEDLNAQRRTVYGWYMDAFRAVPQIKVPFADRDLALATCHILPVLVAGCAEEIRAHLKSAKACRRAGLSTRRFVCHLPQQRGCCALN